MLLRRKKNNLNTFLLYFNLIIKWGKSQKKFIKANLLMLVVAAVTSLYPIAIDFSFNALNEKNITHLMYIPLAIIALTTLKVFLIFIRL